MRILEKKILAELGETRIISINVFSPYIASKAQAGQFVILMVCPEGERIPLTIVDKDKESIRLIFQEVGLTTRLLGRLKVSEELYALLGPLGKPTSIENFGKVVLVGGGVGIAEIYPVAKAFKEKQNSLTTILGARTEKLLILEEELRGISDPFYITTEDGSKGRKGFSTDVLAELLTKEKYALVYAVGPLPMLQKVSQITQSFEIKTIVSLNALMVDATGMCGCCRVKVAGKTKFSCIDGPEFEAHQIDWQELLLRNSMYREKEKHICNLYKL